MIRMHRSRGQAGMLKTVFREKKTREIGRGKEEGRERGREREEREGKPR